MSNPHSLGVYLTLERSKCTQPSHFRILLLGFSLSLFLTELSLFRYVRAKANSVLLSSRTSGASALGDTQLSLPRIGSITHSYPAVTGPALLVPFLLCSPSHCAQLPSPLHLFGRAALPSQSAYFSCPGILVNKNPSC